MRAPSGFEGSRVRAGDGRNPLFHRTCLLGKSSREAGGLALLPCSVYETSALGADKGSLSLVVVAGRSAAVPQALDVLAGKK